MRRFFVLIFCVAVLMSCFTLSISADTPDDGTVNSTALNYFTGVVNKLPANSDYVIYRSGDYTSVMVYGFDFELDGSVVSADDCTMLVYNQRGSGSGNSYTPTFTSSALASFQLSTSSSSIVYSSLGSWPAVGDTSKDNLTYILWSVIFLILIFVVYKHFRNRRHYINL